MYQSYKRDLCEEIGGFFGDFYIDVSGMLVIDTGSESTAYRTEDDLLKDWLPILIESDEATQDDYWADAIDYIRDMT